MRQLWSEGERSRLPMRLAGDEGLSEVCAASTGDVGTIELDETEVRCARENSRNDRWRLLIVENALSTDPRVHMLPNPFHHDSRSLFEFVGNRVRMQFRLDG